MKGKNSGRIFSYAWLILAAILFVPVISVPAAENAGKVSVPFANKSVLLSWNWNDFKESSYTENRRLAAAGIAIAGNAAASDYGSSPYAKVEKTVRALGFTKNIKHLYYSSTKEDYPGMTFAMSSQKVGGKTVVLAVFKGTSSWDDIVTDAKSQLDGFQPAGKHALSELKKYLSGQKLTSKNTILYIVGHSYGGAVASLVAMNASGLAPEKSVFVYTFASPNYYINGTSSTGHGNIHTYVNAADAVPKVPARIDCGKRGSVYTFDYGKDKKINLGKIRRFDLAFHYLTDGWYSSYIDPLKEHMDYTYMSIVMSYMGTQEIMDSFSEPVTMPLLPAAKSSSAGTVVISWKKASHVDGYEIYDSRKENSDYQLLSRIEGKSKTSYTVDGLSGGKTYYFKIRSFINVNGVRVTGRFTDPVKTTVKKAVPSLKLNKSSCTMKTGEKITLKATLKNSKDTVRWTSSSPGVASVSSKGKVTAKKAGTATITASAAGLSVSCKVKVKKITDLSSYYRMPYNKVIKAFKGGALITQYAEYNRYQYKDAVIFSFPKPVAEPSQAPASIIMLKKNLSGCNLFGVTIGMDREKAFRKFRAAGFSRTVAVGITYYWEDSKGRNLSVEADSKVRSISFGAW